MDQAHQLRNIVAMLKDSRESTEKNKTRVVTITSGKGGVGKTTFTVNLAVALSKRGFRVLIIDADFGLSNVNIVLGVNPKYNLYHLISGEKTIYEVIAQGPEGVKLISGGSGISKLMNLDSKQVEVYISQLMKLENVADIILFDTGAGINDNIIKFILSSNEVVLITTPEPTAIMDAYALTKTVSNVDKSIEINLVVNMAQNRQEAINTLNNFKTIAKTYLGMKVSSLGYLINDSAVREAVRRQVPFLTHYPRAAITRNMQDIVDKFVSNPSEYPSENFYKNNLQRFLHRMFKEKV
ncbi:MAG: MinD/ParA family protein [Eubacteriales bacterium]|jgi:flagellar biosynthesis protein FlhG|nr:MinD/ParA family protein [Eubacteriales bacterium]